MNRIKSIFFSPRFFIVCGGLIALFIVGFQFPYLLIFAKVSFGLVIFLLFLDIAIVYQKDGIKASRDVPERLSNGDHNEIGIWMENHYNFPVKLMIIDEVPLQFQLRDLRFTDALNVNEKKRLTYLLRPVRRGAYHFGSINVFAASPIGFVRRKFSCGAEHTVPTYPSFLQMRKYQLLAISNRLTEAGIKKIRRLGHTSEFEQIKEYVRGDDYRTVNWKATARANRLMVNQYTDERAQNVYCLIDKSRVMKMPFEGMALLDYAINASLVMSNIAVYKQDRSGLITFAERIHNCVPASNKAIQLNLILEVLYNQRTRYLEANYERLYAFIKRKINQRSLLILFTNFESITAMRRQLPFLRMLNKSHLLLVVFFENTELRELLVSAPGSMEDMYIKTIGENFAFEKRQIVKELEQNGIISILTPPENLTVSAVNKYLELKARGMI